jgi:type II secretory ATPase GspE/PulE/Tfp pilus assembly ATPase PilB-like protein
MLATSPELRAAVAAGETREKIIEVARRTGWRPMAYDAVRLLKQGVTTVSEIARAVSGEDNDG